jgi:hypothetical protein
MKYIVLILTLAFTMPVQAAPPTTESVQKLMTMTGAAQAAQQIMAQMIPSLKQMAPQTPDSFWKEFAAQIDAEELVRGLIPVYQRHLTQADVNAAIAFYSTQAGKNFIAAQPMIMKESMAVGQVWGQKVATKAIEKLKLGK